MSNEKATAVDPSVLGRGALVFAAGMAMAAASFVVEQFVIKAVKNRI
ncbi:hypothetical protein [Acidipila sp. EB88]|nr:hypothetical protein [Acidipila sp. EB88]